MAQVADVAPKGKPERVEALFEALQTRRESTRGPDGRAPGALPVAFWIDRAVSAAVVKGVVLTAAFAGYSLAAFVVRDANEPSRFTGLAVGTRVPGAPDAMLAGHPDGAGASGYLPPEVIQGVMRRNGAELRACHLQGLARKPGLAGQVLVRFVIAGDGSVSSADDDGSNLPDAAAVACVLAAIERFVFPSPAGGTVTVEYPLVFKPE